MVRTLSRLLIAAALVLTAIPAGAMPGAAATSREDVVWETLPYYASTTELGHFFAVPTSSATFQGRRITNVSSGFSFDTRTPEQYAGKVLEAVWKSSCPARDAQQISKSRKVFLPGAPGQLLVNLQMTVFDPARHRNKNPIAWAELRINGTTLARVERGTHRLNQWLKVDASAQAGVVRLGENTITIVARKAEARKSWGYCWQSPRGIPDFGVAAEVLGLPQADVTATIPPSPFSGSTLEVVATIQNNGPSVLVGDTFGQFTFQTFAETGSADVTSLVLTSTSVTCTSQPAGEGFYGSCPLAQLGPQEKFTVDVYVTVTATACDYSIPVTYRAVHRWTDPDSTNNGESTRSIHCSS